MDKVATKKEIEDLHKLHEVDHDACKKRVREMIAKLDPATKVSSVFGENGLKSKIQEKL